MLLASKQHSAARMPHALGTIFSDFWKTYITFCARHESSTMRNGVEKGFRKTNDLHINADSCHGSIKSNKQCTGLIRSDWFLELVEISEGTCLHCSQSLPFYSC